jgi:PPOX class probable F420-dependent enzyme
MTEISAAIDAYLHNHRTGVLATSGTRAPQQTLVAYHFDGKDILISVRGFSQKAKNLRRNPEASLAVIDGTTQLIVRGRISMIDDSDEVLRLNQQRMRLISTRDETDEEMAQRLRDEQRVILRLIPERFHPPILE